MVWLFFPKMCIIAAMESTEQTQPINHQQNNENEPQPKKVKRKRGRWILLGILLILVGAAIGTYFGWQKAKALRLQEQDNVLITAASAQFEMGLVELENKQYAIAQRRFEYVVQIMPDFPGVQEKLAEVMLAQAMVATPTPMPTPTLTPTPDTRGEEELYNQITQHIMNKDWANSLLALDALRELNLNYRTVDVDGLYYLSLRNRGVQLILEEGSLEPGIYDLALAEGFAPLDVEADNYRSWARRYLNGASYWGLDWPQVVSVFGELYGYLPYLSDSSGMTTTERYRQGLINWGDQLTFAEDWCLASEKYEMALSLMADQTVSQKATEVYNECHKPTEEPTKAPVQATPTPEGTTEVPTEVPTEEPTPTEESNSDPEPTPTPESGG